MEIITIPNIMFAIGILSLIFTVYHYFKNPQIKGEQKDALFSQAMKFMNESTERRFKDIQEGSERRFNEIQKNFESLLLQSNNHINTVDTKVDGLTKCVNEMGNKICTLTAIIDERIPKKQ